MINRRITKKIRFEVFKRDSFTCQYCGRRAPDVILHVDHIKPVAEGGTDDMYNLKTACRDCNSGKGKVELSDDSEIKKHRDELEKVFERKEQITMLWAMFTEHDDLLYSIADNLSNHWEYLTKTEVSERGYLQLRLLARDYRIDQIMRAMDIAYEKYWSLSRDDEDWPDRIWQKMTDICLGIKLGETEPDRTKQLFIYEILRSRVGARDDDGELVYDQDDKDRTLYFINSAYLYGISYSELQSLACTVDSSRRFREIIIETTDEVTRPHD